VLILHNVKGGHGFNQLSTDHVIYNENVGIDH